MKIHYREKNGEIEIVRCFGSDPDIVLPAGIDGKPVTSASAYAFSEKKEKEEEDVFVFEQEEHRIFREEERLIAGEYLESVSFPDTMESIGNYIFYGCRNLKKLRFPNRMMQVGSGAFTGCRSLCSLEIRMVSGKKTCAKEILGDLWQRIDISFASEESEARLVFPEHYEEAVENTPARILFTQHHGSGNNYRQCFYNRETDYKKYDALFAVAKVYDRPDVLTDMALARLMHPEGLAQDAKERYWEYLGEHGKEAVGHLVGCDRLKELYFLSEQGRWTEEALEYATEQAAKLKRQEILSFLMNEKYRLFPPKRKRFEL